MEHNHADIEVRGLTLETIWMLAEVECVTVDGSIYVPTLSYTEEGTEGEPILLLVSIGAEHEYLEPINKERNN